VVDVNINALSVSIANASGHEHRIGLIASRAAAILAARVEQRLSGSSELRVLSANAGNLTGSPLDLDLAHMSDEEAASAIAGSWFQGLAQKVML